MTIASPSRLAVADIKWLVREFQKFPSMARKNFWRKNDKGTTAWAVVDSKRDGWKAVTPCFQRPGIISRRKPLKYSVSGMVGRTG